MKKGLFLISLLLLGLAVVGMADTAFDVYFDALNPEVLVIAQYHNLGAVSAFHVTDISASFMLQGEPCGPDSKPHAYGLIESSVGSPVQVEGYYTAEDGNFESTFKAWGVTVSWGGYTSWQKIDAEGVPEGSLHVSGDAIAWSGSDTRLHFMGSRQVFGPDAGGDPSEAESVVIESVRAGFGHPSHLGGAAGAHLKVEVVGDSPAEFAGSTEGIYWQKDHHTDYLVRPEDRTSGTPLGSNAGGSPYPNVEGVAWDIAVNGSSIVPALELEGLPDPVSLYTTYSFTDCVVEEDHIWGETSSRVYYPGYFIEPTP